MGVIDTFKEPLFEESGVAIPLYVLPMLLLFGTGASLFLAPAVTLQALAFVGFMWPVWLPPMLLLLAWTAWVRFRRAAFQFDQDTILLEIKIPADIQKSPLAMEAVFAGLHMKPGEGNWYAKYWQGKIRPHWSLEIASIEGQIHFFIWTRKGFKRNIETNLYAQFPSVQVIEVEDYTLKQSNDMDKIGLWGCHFTTTHDNDVVPIKTYVDYGLDKEQRDEFKIDPFANMLEFMGSIGKGEQMWVQYMIQVTHKKWRKEGEEKIKDIRGQNEKTEDDKPMFKFLGKDEEKLTEAIERNTSKQAFDVGIRALYLADTDNFDGSKISGLVHMFKQFSSESLNGFRPLGGMTVFSDFPWEPKKPKIGMKKGLLDAYKRRSYFHPPYDSHKPFTLSIEELATLYRLPSRAVEVPTLPRIQSTTAEAPTDLPR